MSSPVTRTLGGLFAGLRQALSEQRAHFNQLDAFNGNHGDHLVAAFDLLAQGLQAHAHAPLPDALHAAAEHLAACQANGTAQVYADGLRHLARHFHHYRLSEAHLFRLAEALPAGDKGLGASRFTQSEVLKALVGALEDWRTMPQGAPTAPRGVRLDSLFAFGMAYLEARARCADDLTALAETAAALSPLSRVPHRFASGKFVIHHLLLALQPEG